MTGVELEDGHGINATTVITTAHPQISFLRLLDRADLPADFVEDIARYKSRSGTVKINVALDRLPDFTSLPGFDPQVHGGTIVLSESLDGAGTKLLGRCRPEVAGGGRGISVIAREVGRRRHPFWRSWWRRWKKKARPTCI